MSNSSLVNVNVPAYSGNYTVGRSGRKVEAITIHHMRWSSFCRAMWIYISNTREKWIITLWYRFRW